MNASALAQLGIALTGVTAIFLTQCKSAELQRYACIFGLAGQPFWIWSAIEAHQWGILAMCALYTFAWGQGIWRYWIRPRKVLPNPIASFAYTKNHLSGFTLTLGFETRDDAHRAHEIAIREFRPCTRTATTRRMVS